MQHGKLMGLGNNKMLFEDKIVILGTSLAEEQDYKNVPLMNTESGKVLMPGVDVHANAIQQLLHQSYIKSPYKELHINSGNYLYHIALILSITVVTIMIVSVLGTYSSTFAMVCLVLFWFNYSIGVFVDNQAWMIRNIFRKLGLCNGYRKRFKCHPNGISNSFCYYSLWIKFIIQTLYRR